VVLRYSVDKNTIAFVEEDLDKRKIIVRVIGNKREEYVEILKESFYEILKETYEGVKPNFYHRFNGIKKEDNLFADIKVVDMLAEMLKNAGNATGANFIINFVRENGGVYMGDINKGNITVTGDNSSAGNTYRDIINSNVHTFNEVAKDVCNELTDTISTEQMEELIKLLEDFLSSDEAEDMTKREDKKLKEIIAEAENEKEPNKFLQKFKVFLGLTKDTTEIVKETLIPFAIYLKTNFENVAPWIQGIFKKFTDLIN